MKLFEFLAKNTSDQGGWVIEFNEHKMNYKTVEEYSIEDEDFGPFENKKMSQKAIDTNKIYSLRWYLNTPVGYDLYMAPTLEDLERWVLQ